MTELHETLTTGDAYDQLYNAKPLAEAARRMLAQLKDQDAEIERLRAVVGFVDSWVSNPVGAYSVQALDGLFAQTRDKINAIERPVLYEQ